MFSACAVMVPTVALTPPPDQAGANWLLRVTFLSLSPCIPIPLCLSLAVSRRSTFGHPEALQCHFLPSNSCLSLIHHEANLQFPGTAPVRQKFVCIACLGLFHTINKALLVGLLPCKSPGCAKSCGCWVFLPCQIRSAQGLWDDDGCWELCTAAEGW